MNEKQTLKLNIQSLAFAMLDLRLFLDTHPTDATAIALMEKYKMKYSALVAEYERRYGPYNMNFDTTGGRWNWVNDPWPWEYAANMEV